MSAYACTHTAAANMFSGNGSLGAVTGTNQCREHWKQQGELSKGQGCFNAFRRCTLFVLYALWTLPFQMLFSVLIFLFGGMCLENVIVGRHLEY